MTSPSKKLTSRFPELKTPGRIVYFDELDPIEEEFLVGRGYVPVVLATMPRVSPSEEQAYLKAYGQGILEGTVKPPRNMATVLKTMFDEAGLLGKKERDKDGVSPGLATAIEDALAWGRSRYTMDNSTHGKGKKDPSKEPKA